MTVERDATQQCLFCEPASALVEIEQRVRPVAGYVDIRQAVIMEIRGHYAQPIMAERSGNARCLRNIGEGSVSIVFVENVVVERQTAWPAGDGQVAIVAIWIRSRFRSLSGIEFQ